MPEEYLLTALKAIIYDIIRRQPFSRHVSNKFALSDKILSSQIQPKNASYIALKPLVSG
jgi:hypothetical protein